MLTNEAWKFVAEMWDDFGADGAPSSRQVRDSIWPDLEEAAVQLLFTAHHARLWPSICVPCIAPRLIRRSLPVSARPKIASSKRYQTSPQNPDLIKKISL